jgi:hypothetical protein
VPSETTPRPLTVSPAEARALLAAERTGGTVVEERERLTGRKAKGMTRWQR